MATTSDIISRNLTQDKPGRPEEGITFEQFLLRTWEDLDHLHPTLCNTFPHSQSAKLHSTSQWTEVSAERRLAGERQSLRFKQRQILNER